MPSHGLLVEQYEDCSCQPGIASSELRKVVGVVYRLLLRAFWLANKFHISKILRVLQLSLGSADAAATAAASAASAAATAAAAAAAATAAAAAANAPGSEFSRGAGLGGAGHRAKEFYRAAWVVCGLSGTVFACGLSVGHKNVVFFHVTHVAQEASGAKLSSFPGLRGLHGRFSTRAELGKISALPQVGGEHVVAAVLVKVCGCFCSLSEVPWRSILHDSGGNAKSQSQGSDIRRERRNADRWMLDVSLTLM